jgi:hypothetical protein
MRATREETAVERPVGIRPPGTASAAALRARYVNAPGLGGSGRDADNRR